MLENCDVYKLNVEDIIDIYCEAELIENKKNKYRTSDGFIKISARASQNAENFVLRYQKIGTECDYRLKERLQMCSGCADMTSFSLEYNDSEIDIYVPYNPLEEINHGTEIEFSNCPSFETTDEDDMIIAFGERSKQPKRKDNNYDQLIMGWEDAFGKFSPTVLKVKVDSLEVFGGEKRMYLLSFEIHEKHCKKKFAELMFVDCKDVSFEMFFPIEGNCEIVMSKMANGQIYVGLDGLGIDFFCSSVFEYNYYCNQNN